MLVSPAKGTFHQRRRGRRRRRSLDAGAPIGEVASLARPDRRSPPPHGGTVVEWLVEDGDLVSPGQPLVRLHPEGSHCMTATIATVRPAPRTPRILGIGAYRPSRVVPNAEIVEAIDSSDEWIQQRSGIKQRRWAAPRRDRAVDVASPPRAQALERAGIDAAQIDCVDRRDRHAT